MAARNTPSNAGLSRGLLQMKFMQKTATNLNLEEDEEEMGALEEQWVIDALPQDYMSTPNEPEDSCSKDQEFFEFDNSITILEELEFGRMSFKGMNPEIEFLMKSLLAEGEDDDEEEEDSSITNEEMATRYNTFVKNVDQKFKTKRQRREEESSDEETTSESIKKQRTSPSEICAKVKTFLKPEEYQ